MNEQYLLYRNIKKLQLEKGQHTELITLYVAAGRDLNLVKSQLEAERQQAQNIKDKTNRRNVATALTRLINLVKTVTNSQNGYCLFGSKDDALAIIPPHKNTIDHYHCGKLYILDVLKNLANSENILVYGLIALDGSECTIAKLTGSRLEILEEIDSEVKNKVIKGGQSARRYRNAREQSLNHYFGEVSSYINLHFEDSTVKLYYGGNIPSSEQYLYSMPGLRPTLKPKFSSCYPLPYADKFGIKCLLGKIAEDLALTEYRLAKEQLKELETKLKFNPYGWSNKPTGDVKTIYLTEDHLVEDHTDYLETVKIRVYWKGHPVYDYLSQLHGGCLYLA